MKEPTKPEWNEFNDLAFVDWRRIRSSIEHENDLTHHRQTWLLTSQGFLFAAFGYVFTSAFSKDVPEQFRPLFPWLLGLIALMGVLISTLIQRSINQAERQHQKLRRWWQAKYGDEDAKIEPEKNRRHPPIAGDVHPKFAPSRLPIVFIIAWIGGLILAAASSGLLTKESATNIGYVFLIVVGVIAIAAAGYTYGRRHHSSSTA